MLCSIRNDWLAVEHGLPALPRLGRRCGMLGGPKLRPLCSIAGWLLCCLHHSRWDQLPGEHGLPALLRLARRDCRGRCVLLCQRHGLPGEQRLPTGALPLAAASCIVCGCLQPFVVQMSASQHAHMYHGA